MNSLKEGAAPGKHHHDGPPRLNSSRCGNYFTPAKALNQSSSGAPSVNTRKSGERMNQELIEKKEGEFSAIEQVVMQGDLSKLNSEQRVTYYRKVCESQGLNPFTNPFAYIFLNGKLTLYAKKDCTEQLRKINGVSIEELDDKLIDDIYVVTAKARDKHGRVDQAKGAVVIGSLKGEAKANAIMKAETKAKRRVTLSICGMGWTDESEIESIPNAKPVDVDFDTGEIKNVSATVTPVITPMMVVHSKITERQVSELKTILNDCDGEYRNWFYSFVQRTFGTEDLSGITSDRFEGAKSAALSNLEEHYSKLENQAQPELLAAGAR